VANATQQDEEEVVKKRYKHLAMAAREKKESLGVVGMIINYWRERERRWIRLLLNDAVSSNFFHWVVPLDWDE
jgi:hypothetical protein